MLMRLLHRLERMDQNIVERWVYALIAFVFLLVIVVCAWEIAAMPTGSPETNAVSVAK